MSRVPPVDVSQPFSAMHLGEPRERPPPPTGAQQQQHEQPSADSLHSHWARVQSSAEHVRQQLRQLAGVFVHNARLLHVDESAADVDLQQRQRADGGRQQREKDDAAAEVDVNEKDDFLMSLPQSGLIQLLKAEKVRHAHALALLESCQRRCNAVGERSSLCDAIVKGQMKRIEELSRGFETLAGATHAHHLTSQTVVDSLTQKLLEQRQAIDKTEAAGRRAEAGRADAEHTLESVGAQLAQCRAEADALKEQAEEGARRLEEESRAKHESEIQLQRTNGSLVEMQKNHSSFLSEMEGFEQKLSMREAQLEQLRQDKSTFERTIDELQSKQAKELHRLESYCKESSRRERHCELEQVQLRYADQVDALKMQLRESESNRQAAESSLKQLEQSLQEAHMQNVAMVQGQLTRKVNELLNEMGSGGGGGTAVPNHMANGAVGGSSCGQPAAYSQPLGAVDALQQHQQQSHYAPASHYDYVPAASADFGSVQQQQQHADAGAAADSMADEFLQRLRYANVLDAAATVDDTAGASVDAAAAAQRKAQLQAYLKMMVESKYGGGGGGGAPSHESSPYAGVYPPPPHPVDPKR